MVPREVEDQAHVLESSDSPDTGRKKSYVSLIWTIIGLAVLFVWFWRRIGTGELRGLPSLLKTLDIKWIIVVLVFQSLFVLWQVLLYLSLYRIQGIAMPLGRLYLMVLASTAAGRILPVGAVASVATLVETAKKEGAPRIVSAAVSGLYYLFDYALFSLFIVFSVAYIGLTHIIPFTAGIPLLVVLMLCLLAAGLLVFSSGLSPGPQKGIIWMCQFINGLSMRIRQKPAVRINTVTKSLQDILTNLRSLKSKPKYLIGALVSAFFITLIDVLSIECIFLSLGLPQNFGVLVSGFTLGTVLSFLTFVPNGLGVYVVSLWSVYHAMGVPEEAASAVSMLYRLLTYWVPAAAGILAWLALRKTMKGVVRDSSGFYRRTAVTRRWRSGMAILSVVVGLASLASSLFVVRPHLLGHLPFHIRWGSKVATAIVGFLLLLNAPGLLRGRRVSWTIATGMAGSAAFLHLLRGFNIEGAALSITFGTVLFLSKRFFNSPSNPKTFWRAIHLLLAVVLFNFSYSFMALRMTPRMTHATHPTDLATLARHSISLMAFSASPEVAHGLREPRAVINAIYAVNATSILVATLLFLQPLVIRRESSSKELELAQSIAREWGHSSLAYFTLWPDKTLYFNERGTAYLAYKQVRDTAVVLGDPIGPPEERKHLIGLFISHMYDRGIDVAFYQVLPEHLDDYRQAGMKALKCGEEAIVDLKTFDLKGNRWKSLRYTWNKAKKDGLTAVFYSPPLEERLVEELQEVSSLWLSAKRIGEKGFSLGWFDPEIVRHLEVSVAVDSHGKVQGFLTFVPMYNLNQVSPDLMRYRPASPTGIIDFLLIESALYCAGKGFSALNLGLAPLARVTPEEKVVWTDRVIETISKSMPNLKGLYLFKQKYHPKWEPRYLIYPSQPTLPRVALAVVQAGNPRGLVKYVKMIG